ncbi:MAG: LptF/LptG family permease [Pseudomonadota bacterium]
MQYQIRNNYSAVLLQEGVFTTIDEGLTIFVREQGRGGELFGIMVNDSRLEGKPVTMVAERGAIVNTAEGPRIVMISGNRQELTQETGKLSFPVLRPLHGRAQPEFEGGQRGALPRVDRAVIGELLDPDDVDDPRIRAALRSDGHQRLASPLYALTFVLVALASLLCGEFSRRGQTWRVITAVALVVGIQALGIGLANLSSKFPLLTILIYLNAILPGTCAFYLLVGSPRGQRRAAVAAPA